MEALRSWWAGEAEEDEYEQAPLMTPETESDLRGRIIYTLYGEQERLEREEILARLMPRLISFLAVFAGSYYSFAIAHFGPQVEVQLAWALVTVLGSIFMPKLVEPIAVGAITGMSSKANPRIIPGFGWLFLPTFFAAIIWQYVDDLEVAAGNGGRYGTVSFAATNLAVLLVMMPAGAAYWDLWGSDGAVGRWDHIVRYGLVLRYLATCPVAALATRITKIMTGHESITAGAACALLMISITQCIGRGVSRRYVADVTSAITVGAFVGISEATTLQTTHVPLCAVLAVGVRLLLAPFCKGFAGKEALSAFLAVLGWRCFQPREQQLFP